MAQDSARRLKKQILGKNPPKLVLVDTNEPVVNVQRCKHKQDVFLLSIPKLLGGVFRVSTEYEDNMIPLN